MSKKENLEARYNYNSKHLKTTKIKKDEREKCEWGKARDIISPLT